jgi:hypothetical protein
MHLHLVQFRVLDRSGVLVKSWQAYPKDTVERRPPHRPRQGRAHPGPHEVLEDMRDYRRAASTRSHTVSGITRLHNVVLPRRRGTTVVALTT